MDNNEITKQTCPAVAYQMSSVCVPVTVRPFATVDATVTKCCGSATVTPGKSICDGLKNGACVFTIGQNICVEVPVRFGAVAEVGDTYVNCSGATAEDICTECNQPVMAPTETIENPI